MIISHQHKFIFLKTRKTAGTSIEVALSRFCGPEDIITTLDGEAQALRDRIGAARPQNYRTPLRHWTGRDVVKFFVKGRRARYTQHMSAMSLRPRIDADVWRTYYKFCVERNPYDKAISLYFWRTKDLEVRPSLQEFLRAIDAESLSNFHIYSIDDRIAVDKVIRYERLQEELSDLMHRFGLPDVTLPKAKGNHRLDRRPHTELLTEEDREIVERVCSREIGQLGYEFD